jgi:hypothetical protein
MDDGVILSVKAFEISHGAKAIDDVVGRASLVPGNDRSSGSQLPDDRR